MENSVNGTGCSCGCNCGSGITDVKMITSIKVLGTGCKSCHAQYEAAQKAIEQLGLSLEVDYVTDIEEIVAYGVMSMPALVVNEEVISTGRALNAVEIIKLLGKLGY